MSRASTKRRLDRLRAIERYSPTIQQRNSREDLELFEDLHKSGHISPETLEVMRSRPSDADLYACCTTAELRALLVLSGEQENMQKSEKTCIQK